MLKHLAPSVWQGENLAYTKPAPTVHEAQTEYARMMPQTIQEVVKDRVFHAYEFQVASSCRQTSS